jgi:hypothetical protein
VSRNMSVCAALVAAIACVIFVGAQPPNLAQQKIAAKVLSDLRTNGRVTFFVVMTDQADTTAGKDLSCSL